MEISEEVKYGMMPQEAFSIFCELRFQLKMS